MISIVGVGLSLLLVVATIFAANARRRELIEWALPLAVLIARAQGWVSPHRLINRLHITKSDAAMVLREACVKGLLYQAVNGKYYVNLNAMDAIDVVEAQAEEEPERSKSPYPGALLALLATVGISVIMYFAFRDNPPDRPVAANVPPEPVAAQEPPAKSTETMPPKSY